MRTFAVLAVVAAALSFNATAANAEGKYWPWCAQYDGWTIVCGFATFQQCLATISGVGGICQPNVVGPPAAERYATRRVRHAQQGRRY